MCKDEFIIRYHYSHIFNILPGGSGTMGRRLMPNTVTPGHTHVGGAVEENYYKYVVDLVGYRKPYVIVGR